MASREPASLSRDLNKKKGAAGHLPAFRNVAVRPKSRNVTLSFDSVLLSR